MTNRTGSKQSRSAGRALPALMDDMGPVTRQILARYRIPPQDAEDLLQQTWLAYLVKHREVRESPAWICGTLRKLCLLYWRQRRRSLWQTVDSAILESLASPSPPEQERSDLRSDLDSVMSKLSGTCRSVLRLRYRLGCPPQETADRLGYSASSIYKITERCLAALSRRLLIGGFTAADRTAKVQRTANPGRARVKKCRPRRRAWFPEAGGSP